jgi:hypothetical protein
MQKKAQVAKLDLDEALEVTASEEKYERLTADDIATLPQEDPRYQSALKLLQHGATPKKIAAKLVKEGVLEYRNEALQLALRVSKENPQEQITNAYILFAAAAIFTLAALLFIVPNVVAIGLEGILQPSLLLLIVAAWLGFKGYQTLQSTSG